MGKKDFLAKNPRADFHLSLGRGNRLLRAGQSRSVVWGEEVVVRPAAPQWEVCGCSQGKEAEVMREIRLRSHFQSRENGFADGLVAGHEKMRRFDVSSHVDGGAGQ